MGSCQSMKLDGNHYDQSTPLASFFVLYFQSLLGQNGRFFSGGLKILALGTDGCNLIRGANLSHFVGIKKNLRKLYYYNQK